jgi:hypothetical protein
MVTLVQPGMPRRGVGFSDIAADVLQTLNRADLVTVLADMRVLTAAQLARVLRRMADRIEDDGVVVYCGPDPVGGHCGDDDGWWVMEKTNGELRHCFYAPPDRAAG